MGCWRHCRARLIFVELQALVSHLQASDALWMSMLLSAFAGLIAISVVIATFYFIRWTLVCPWHNLQKLRTRHEQDTQTGTQSSTQAWHLVASESTKAKLSVHGAFGCACSRRHRIRSLPGHFGYRLMAGGEDGMTPAELRALPVIIHEKPIRSSRQQEGPSPPAICFESFLSLWGVCLFRSCLSFWELFVYVRKLNQGHATGVLGVFQDQLLFMGPVRSKGN